jgi:hypothetical protein
MSTIRLGCSSCGSHVLVDDRLHRPGGNCQTCHSYDLVPLGEEGSNRSHAIRMADFLTAHAAFRERDPVAA